MSIDKNKQGTDALGIDSTLLPDIDISKGEGDYSEAIRLAVKASVVKKKTNGLPIGVHHKDVLEKREDKASKDKAKTLLKDKRVTARMRAFASYVALGDTPREAICKAYNMEKSSQATIMVLANRLMNDVRINVLLESFSDSTKESVLAQSIATRKHVLNELYDHAQNKEVPLSLRIRSLELLGKSVGMFTDRVETNTETADIEQLKEELKQSISLLDETDRVREQLKH